MVEIEKIYKAINQFIETSKNKTSIERIDIALKSVLDLYDADRAYIFEVYPNIMIGNCSYEVCNKEVKSIKDFFKEIDCNLVPICFKQIRLVKPYILNNIDEIKNISKSEYDFLNSLSINKMYAVPFKQGDFLGMIGVVNPKNDLDIALLEIFNSFINQDVINVCLEKNKNTSICPYVLNSNDVYIRLLGKFEIFTYNNIYGSSLVNSRQCFAFLLYMLIYRSDYISIDRITKIVWPNVELFEPYQYVKNMVFRVRKALNFNDIIVPDNGSYKINPKYNITLDIEIFNELYNKFINEKNTKVKVEFCEKMLELYKGNLNELLYEYTWIFNLSINYYKNYKDVLQFYLDYLMKNKEYEKIISFCSKKLAISANEPLLHKYIILAHFNSGDIKVSHSYLACSKKIFSEEEYNNISKYLDDNYF